MLAGAALLLAGCEEMLNFNLFSAVDTPQTPSADKIDAMSDSELLDEIEQLMETDTFFADIAENDEIRTALVENLSEIYAGGSDADLEEQQRASLLVAEIELNTTAAGIVVNDFVNVLTEFIEEPPESDGPEELVEALVSQVFSSVTADNFDQTLDALLAAAEAYTFYGESLDDTGEVVAPENVNSGAVAQDAIVAILISEIVDDDQPGLLSVADLRSIVVDGEPFPDDFVIENNPLEENIALVNILDASGLEGFFAE